jgi:hypothetical protein
MAASMDHVGVGRLLGDGKDGSFQNFPFSSRHRPKVLGAHDSRSKER